MAKKDSSKSVPVVRKTDTKERNKALEIAWESIERNFGKGSLMKLGEQGHEDADAIPTGILPLDLALGIGGVPRGRIIEIYGHESSGKTTVALHMIAEAQKGDGNAAFIDAEHALDPVYAQKLGVDIDNLIVSQPDNGEQALEIAEALVRSGALDIIVIDSVAALVPKNEIEGNMADAPMGMHARLMSKALRKLTPVISRSSTVVVFINQVREKISSGGYTGGGGGPQETTTGGRALKFYASIRMDVRRTGSVKLGDELVGSRVKVRIVKNKMAPPFKQAEFDLMFGKGAVKSACILDMAMEHKIVKRSGSWFSMGDERLGQGREKIKLRLEEEPDLMERMEAEVRKALLSSGGTAAADQDADSKADAKADRDGDDDASDLFDDEPITSDDDIDDLDDLNDDILDLDDL